MTGFSGLSRFTARTDAAIFPAQRLNVFHRIGLSRKLFQKLVKADPLSISLVLVHEIYFPLALSTSESNFKKPSLSTINDYSQKIIA